MIQCIICHKKRLVFPSRSQKRFCSLKCLIVYKKQQVYSIEHTKKRFWKKVNKTKTCWIWTASTCNGDYGNFIYFGKMLKAHRISYQWLKGPIPKNMTLDHLCRVPRCVNPDHLEIVTMKENLLRGKGNICIVNTTKTHCPKGHLFNPNNLVKSRLPYRLCLICRTKWTKNYLNKHKK